MSDSVVRVYLVDQLLFPGQVEPVECLPTASAGFVLVNVRHNVGILVKALEHQPNVAQGEEGAVLGHTLVCAQDTRLLVADLTHGPTGYTARVRPFADTPSERDALQQQAVLQQAHHLIAAAMGHRRNPVWRSVAQKVTQPPPYGNLERLSFWLCTVLRWYQVAEESLLDLFLSIDAVARLQAALELFRALPGVRALHSRPPPGLRAIRESSATISRQLQRWGGLRPRKRKTLKNFCIDTLFHDISLDELETLGLVSLGSEVLQPLVDRYCDYGLLSEGLLCQLRGALGVHTLRLTGSGVMDDWLLHCILDGFPRLRRLELLACNLLTEDAVVQTLSHLPGLSSLSLERCKHVTDNLLIRTLPFLDSLTELTIAGTQASLPTFWAIGQHCPHLRLLNVCGLRNFCGESRI